MILELHCPLAKSDLRELKAGDNVLLSGTIYTARDAAHQKMAELLERGENLPFDINGAVIYYVGPTPPLAGCVIGSAGPTTSYRMDAYTPNLLALGLSGMIGKGRRNDDVVAAMVRHGAVYFGAIGGAGALISQCIKKVEVVAWPELGTESLRRMQIEKFPVTVVVDSQGRSLYLDGPKNFLAFKENNHG